MGAHEKTREPRRNLILPARLRDDGGWHDATIRNVSSRGLMATCDTPPAKGAFVEIRHRTICIVGHIRWVNGTRFGLRSQDKIDVIGLIAGQASPSAAPGNDRRTAPRSPEPAEVAARSRALAKVINWSIAAAVLVTVAGFAASTVSSALRTPLDKVGKAMGGNP